MLLFRIHPNQRLKIIVQKGMPLIHEDFDLLNIMRKLRTIKSADQDIKTKLDENTKKVFKSR